MGHIFRSWLLTVGLAALPLTARAETPPADRIGYNQYIRPILSDNCLYCHGPDKNHRKAKLRLDDRDVALDKKAIVPGKPDESELINRILSTDADELMPPPETHKKLTAKQKELLKQWIAQGAEYEPHWAYITPKRPAAAVVKNTAWVRNQIDGFVLQTLERRRLAPSREADRVTLLRRLSLDLIGLPPTPEEVAAFASDTSPNAYEKQVDRLLASPHYGERMAVPWLDAVRFADTVGFHGDQNQNVFPYRDYVIDAFNHNKPFDQFTIEQIAGDLLPKPTSEQLTATCFNRLTMMTREGGAQPKEYLAKYAADRVRTVSEAWLGSTMGCCECHDHKFDPFKAKDFYSLEAFWADVKQWGVYADYNYTPNPDLRGYNNDYPFPPEAVVENAALKARVARLKAKMDEAAGAARQASAFAAWEQELQTFDRLHPDGWSTPRLAKEAKSTGAAAPSGGVVVFAGSVAADDRVEFELTPGMLAAIRLRAEPSAEHGGSIHRAVAAKAEGKSKKAVAAAAPMVQLAASIRHGDGKVTKLAFAFADADLKAEKYSNGHAVLGIKVGWLLSPQHDHQAQTATYLLEAPLKAAAGDVLVIDLPKNTLGRIQLSVSPWVPLDPTKPLRTSAAGPADNQPGAAVLYVLTSDATLEVRAQLRRLQQEIIDCRGGKSPVLVTQAIAPVTTRILPRGNWQDETGEIVEPNVPQFLPQPPAHEGRRLTRLDLAKWIVSPENPLTARTIMNRTWKQLFGNGLSGNVEDLGNQGEWPSHPELLDWLAVEFRESGWDVKHMVKLIVTSAAYRQDSNLRPELKDSDPQNRLLASQSPRRLEAEFVRDNALFAAGVLNTDIGGPSAFPYQPEGYYANIQFPNRTYVASLDERQYRRGVYSHWQRTFLHPMLANFDAPSREDGICTRNVSNTPQQALTLLNDPSFVEAARALAASVSAARGTDTERLELVYRRVLSRDPKAKESASLAKFLSEQRAYFKSNPADATKLLQVGVAPKPAGDEAELAAWTNVCRVVLNLHESITRY